MCAAIEFYILKAKIISLVQCFKKVIQEFEWKYHSFCNNTCTDILMLQNVNATLEKCMYQIIIIAKFTKGGYKIKGLKIYHV